MPQLDKGGASSTRRLTDGPDAFPPARQMAAGVGGGEGGSRSRPAKSFHTGTHPSELESEKAETRLTMETEK